jgi:hypothetical protein
MSAPQPPQGADPADTPQPDGGVPAAAPGSEPATNEQQPPDDDPTVAKDFSEVVSKPRQRRFSAAWREHLQSRVIDLAVEVDCLARSSTECKRRLTEAKRRLAVAAQIIEKRARPWSAWTGVDVERAWVNVHAVEVTLIRLSPATTVAAKLPDIIAEAQQVLRPNDPRLQRLCEYSAARTVDDSAREPIAEIVTAIHAATASEHVRARSFRNILLSATIALTIFSVAFAVLGSFYPNVVDLCAPATATSEQPASGPAVGTVAPTCPSSQANPTGTDVWVVELLGLFSASLIGAVAIRKMRGTSTPYAVPMASLLVKLPTGALTAVGGLLLIRAGVLGPAVAASATAQVVAYALAFGASQQSFTRLIDNQAQTVLDSLPSADRDPAKSSQTGDAG